MADLHRSVAVAGLPLLIGLGGCGAPISNQVFLEEALFVGALPGAVRLAPPEAVFLAPAGDAVVLGAAKRAATDWDELVLVLAASGDALREATPSERTEAVRTWAPVNVARRVDGGPLGFPAGTADWWVRGEVERVGDREVVWSLELAAHREGDWVEVAGGTHDARVGDFTWDLEATAVALDLAPAEPPGTLAVDYDDEVPDTGARSVVAVSSIDTVAVRSWTGIGEEGLGFSGALALTDDGETWPASTTALHTGDGGRAQGELQRDGGRTVSFTSCWDADGDTTWVGGDPGIVPRGAAADCALPEF